MKVWKKAHLEYISLAYLLMDCRCMIGEVSGSRCVAPLYF